MRIENIFQSWAILRTGGLIFVFTLAFTAMGSRPDPATIQWVSMQEAFEKNLKKPKKIMVDIYTVWCGPCRRMNSETFHHPYIVDYVNKHYYPVKFNAEGNDTVEYRGQVLINRSYNPERASTRNGTHDFTRAFAPVQGRVAYPTIAFFDEQNNLIQPVQGMIMPAGFEPILAFFAEDAYKSVPWPDYQAAFKSKIQP
jgi:thioredoxin-related protein